MTNSTRLIWIAGLAVLLGPLTAVAVPSLGVATGNGYICSSEDAAKGDCPGPYQTYDFDGDGADNPSYVGPHMGAQEGFILGPSSDALYIFTNILDADIWLLTDSTVQRRNSPTIDGSALTSVGDTGQFGGYKPEPYFGINLGTVFTGGALNSGWDLLPADPYSPSPFYVFTAQLDYSKLFLGGHYFFAVADDNGLAGLQANGMTGPPGPGKTPDSFSPKTTSAVAIAEPGTLMLLGLGLLALGVISRRKTLG